MVGNKKITCVFVLLGVVMLCTYLIFYTPIVSAVFPQGIEQNQTERAKKDGNNKGNSSEQPVQPQEEPSKKETTKIVEVNYVAPTDPIKLAEYYKPIPKIDSNVIDPLFWIEKTEDADTILMDVKAIQEFNRKNIEHYDQLTDLSTVNEYTSKDELRAKILKASSIPTAPRYDSTNKRMTNEDYNKLTEKLNLSAISDRNQVRFGVTWRRTQMKAFPIYEGAYAKPGDFDFDMFMETAIYPIEPVVIYHESADGNWYFAQMYNYTGWVPKQDVAIADKQTIFSFVNSPQFLMVTSSQIEITIDEHKIIYDMGVKIPIGIPTGDGIYNCILPLSREDGTLSLNLVPLAQSQHLNVGYLPYSRANIIKQAFEFQGERYGWGGMYNARDCSAFIMDIYRTFGIKLPRNASQQGRGSYGVHYFAQNLRPVSPIYMNGHTMLYLGEYNGEGYIIHDFAGFYRTNSGGGTSYEKVMRALVTPLSIQAAPGRTFRASLYGGREFLLP